MKTVYRLDLKRIFVVLIWALVIGLTVVKVVSQQIKINDYCRQVDDLDSSIEALSEHRDELDKQSELYASDEYIERVARERLGFVRSDEIVLKKAD